MINAESLARLAIALIVAAFTHGAVQLGPDILALLAAALLYALGGL